MSQSLERRFIFIVTLFMNKSLLFNCILIIKLDTKRKKNQCQLLIENVSVIKIPQIIPKYYIMKLSTKKKKHLIKINTEIYLYKS